MVDKRVSTNHKGRQRPPPVSPLEMRKAKIDAEYSLGYVDPEKEIWEKCKAIEVSKYTLYIKYRS